MPAEDSSIKDKLCLITGATSGIGLVTARVLAERGARLVIVGRNPEKVATSLAYIQQASGSVNVESLLADLSEISQVRQLAQEFNRRYTSLDVLVNNAGAFFLRRQLTVDGIERTLAVNYLSVFLLTNLLLEALKNAAPSRVIIVASDTHRGARLNLDDLGMKRGYNWMKAYGQSKLAEVLFTYELARRLKGSGVTVNALHPGVVATNIWRGEGWMFKMAAPLMNHIGISPEEGARISVYLASAPELECVTGKYFNERQQAVPSTPASYNEADARRLWDLSADITCVKS